MSFTQKIARNIGSTSTVSGSIISALERGVDYVLGMVKATAPSQLGLFANEFKIGASIGETSVTTSDGPVNSVSVTAMGVGYSSATIAFTGGGGSGASATVQVLNTRVVAVHSINGGSGYTSAPTATISGDGSGATATATISTTSSTVTSPSLFNLRDKSIYSVLKVIRDGHITQPVSEDQRYATSDSTSIYYSQKVSPSYFVDSAGDLTITPDTSPSSKGSIYAVVDSSGKTIDDTNETIKDNAYTLTSISFVAKELFPKVWKELVVLHASELLLIEKLSDFTSKLPTDLDTDTTLFDALADIDLTPHGVTFPLAEVNDALTKAQNLIDGTSMGDDSATAESAQFWLLDEDEDMVGSTLSVAAQELGRANGILGRFTTELSSSTADLGLKEKEFQINLQKKMALYDKIIQKLSTDYQWHTQQLQIIAGKKQEFIQAKSSIGSSDNPKEPPR